MAIVTSYDALITINAVDVSDHCKMVVVDDGQETRECTSFGSSVRTYRAGLGTPSISATFHNDWASGSVEATLRSLIGLSASSSGVTVTARPVNGTISTSNPLFTLVGIPDGGLPVLNASVGEIPEITVRFLPYTSAFTVQTTSS